MVIDFKPANPRICFLRIKLKFKNYFLISVRAPTKASLETKKEDYYDLLDESFDQCPYDCRKHKCESKT